MQKLLGAFAFVAAAGTLAAFAATAFQPSELFRGKCAKCHGEDGRGETPKGRKLDAQDFTDPDFQSHRSDKQLIEAVTNGTQKNMPAFGRNLSAAQIETLVKQDVRGFWKR